MVTNTKEDKPEEEQSQKNLADPDEVPGPENKDSQNSVAEGDHKKTSKPKEERRKQDLRAFQRKGRGKNKSQM